MKNLIYSLRCPHWVLGILLAASIVATAPPPASAQATGGGTSSAVIITPIEVDFVQTLVFGTFALTDPAAGGTVTVPAAGGATSSSGVFVTGTPASSGLAKILGEANALYQLLSGTSLTSILTIPGGGTPMTATLSYFSSTTLTTALVTGGTAQGGQLNPLAFDNLGIGGVLVIPPFVEPGDYVGSVNVTVDY